MLAASMVSFFAGGVGGTMVGGRIGSNALIRPAVARLARLLAEESAMLIFATGMVCTAGEAAAGPFGTQCSTAAGPTHHREVNMYA